MRISKTADKKYHHWYYMQHRKKYILRQRQFRKNHHGRYLERARESYYRSKVKHPKLTWIQKRMIANKKNKKIARIKQNRRQEIRKRMNSF